MNRKLIVVIVLLIGMAQVHAQGIKVTGRVLMSDSITPLPGALVHIVGTHLGDATNGNGYFELVDIPALHAQLEISMLGFTSQIFPIAGNTGDLNGLNFYLTEEIQTTHEVLILSGGSSGIKYVPGSVTYLSPRELSKFSYTDINRALRLVPGVNVQEEDGFGLRPNIGLRGTGVERSSKITVMEDGILTAPAPYADPSAYYFPSMGRMQAIEISKGSSQIKYGPYTTGGAINLIATSIPDKLSARVNMLGGNYGMRNLQAYAGNSHRHVSYLVETFQYGSDGFKDLDGGGNTGFSKQDYLTRLRFQTNAEARIFQSLSFKAGQADEVSHETYLGLTNDDYEATPYRRYAGSQKDQMTTRQNQFSATHVLRAGSSFSITTTAYWTRFKRNWYRLNSIQDSTNTKFSIATVLDQPATHQHAYDIARGASLAGDNVLYVRSNNRAYTSRGIQSVAHFEKRTGKLNHDVEMGVRLHYDEVDRFQWEDQYTMHNSVMELISAGTPGTQSNLINSARALAGWMQYKLKWSGWTISPGLRYEHIEMKSRDFGTLDLDRTGEFLVQNQNTVDVVVPGFGIDYQFNKFASLFGGVHKGFSPPGPKDETNPEQSINYELGGRYQKNAFSGQAIVFMNDYNNLLGADLSASGGGGTGDLFNAGKVQTRGVELTLGWDALANIQSNAWSLPMNLAYTFTDAEFKNSFTSTFADWSAVKEGDQFPYLARHQVGVQIGLEHARWNLNLSVKYMDKMRTAPGSEEIPANYLIPSYTIVDASFSYQAHEHISFFCNATNITNETYLVARRPAGLRPGMPAAFNLGIKAQF